MLASSNGSLVLIYRLVHVFFFALSCLIDAQFDPTRRRVSRSYQFDMVKNNDRTLSSHSTSELLSPVTQNRLQFEMSEDLTPSSSSSSLSSLVGNDADDATPRTLNLHLHFPAYSRDYVLNEANTTDGDADNDNNNGGEVKVHPFGCSTSNIIKIIHRKTS